MTTAMVLKPTPLHTFDFVLLMCWPHPASPIIGSIGNAGNKAVRRYSFPNILHQESTS